MGIKSVREKGAQILHRVFQKQSFLSKCHLNRPERGEGGV